MCVAARVGPGLLPSLGAGDLRRAEVQAPAAVGEAGGEHGHPVGVGLGAGGERLPIGEERSQPRVSLGRYF